MYDIFLINLAQHHARLAFMRVQFETLGLNFTRIEAVNGYDPVNIAHTAAASYAPLPNGEIGCFESHRSVWKRIVEKNLPGAYVCEDDVVISSDFAEIRYPKEVLENTDYIKVDTYPRNCAYGSKTVPLSRGRHLQRLLGTENSAGCYFITRRGAEQMLAASQSYFIPVDILMFAQESRVFWNMTVWKVFPSIAAQMRFYMSCQDLPDEIADNIQTRRRENRDPRPTETLLRMTRLRLRRLMDRDTKSTRQQRARRNMDAFALKEPVETACVLFQTKTCDHIEAGLAAMNKHQSQAS